MALNLHGLKKQTKTENKNCLLSYITIVTLAEVPFWLSWEQKSSCASGPPGQQQGDVLLYYWSEAVTFATSTCSDE